MAAERDWVAIGLSFLLGLIGAAFGAAIAIGPQLAKMETTQSQNVRRLNRLEDKVDDISEALMRYQHGDRSAFQFNLKRESEE